MKKLNSMIIGFVLMFCVVAVQAQNVCDSVLQYGARNIVSNMTVEQQKSYVFQKACKNRYKDSNNETKLGIEAVIKSVPIGLNFGQGNSQTKIENWCNENQKYDDNSFIAVNYESTVFQPSIAAWSSCIEATTAGLEVKPNITGDETGITFQITNTTGDKDVVLQGVNIIDSSNKDSIVCKVKTNTSTEIANDETRKPLLPKDSVNVNCQRKLVKVTRDNQEIEIFPSGSITLNTKLKNFQISLLEKSVVQLTDFRANKINQRLDELDKQFFIGNGCMRINKTQICWGKVDVKEGSAVWNRHFEVVFPKAFAKTPIVTQGINTNSNGHGVAIYKWNISEKGFSGGLNNMHVQNKADPGEVTMDYMAIGEAIE